MSSILQLQNIRRSFTQGGQVLPVLQGVDLELKAGELVALVGPSGAGKSTLLHIAGLLERPESGNIFINGQAIEFKNDDFITAQRRKTIGFVYQAHHLLPEFNALENVRLPQQILGLKNPPVQAEELLAAVGLASRATHRPYQLSGGEQQRVALARALANAPRLLLADEPTGNLDPHTAEDVFGVIQNLVRQTGVAALIATHNLEMARKMDRVMALVEGKLAPANYPHFSQKQAIS
ncbi:MAG: ABC transporter ATP-binding protein [Dongiaceae bacterium]